MLCKPIKPHADRKEWLISVKKMDIFAVTYDFFSKNNISPVLPFPFFYMHPVYTHTHTHTHTGKHEEGRFCDLSSSEEYTHCLHIN